MQLNANHFKYAMWACMILLFIMMFDLPHGAYVFLNSVVSLALLSISAYFLRPVTNFVLHRKDHFREYFRYDQTTHTVSGYLDQSHALDKTNLNVETKIPLNPENSVVIKAFANSPIYGSNHYQPEKFYIRAMPPISEPMAIILMALALAFNPLAGIEMPKGLWASLDFITICILISALVMTNREIKGTGKPEILYEGLNNMPDFPDRSIWTFLDDIKSASMSICAAAVVFFVMVLFKIGSEPKVYEVDFLRLSVYFMPLVFCSIVVVLMYLYVDFIASKGIINKNLRVMGATYFFTLIFLVAAGCVYSTDYIEYSMDQIIRYQNQDHEDPGYDYEDEPFYRSR